MKKIIIGFSGLIVLIFLIVFAVNAQNNDKEVRKAKSEVSKDCSQCPSTATCIGHSSSKTAACDPAKCAEMKCDPAKCKEGKCDPAKCKTNCKDASSEMKCDPAKCNHQVVTKK
jgi:hypothetical protein